MRLRVACPLVSSCRTFHQVEKDRVEVLAGFARQLALPDDGADLLVDLTGERRTPPL
jgi:hypothetical protein